jgi:hypothetical protein
MATTWAGTATNQGITRTAMNDLWNTYTTSGYPWCDGCSQPADSLQLITKSYFTANYYFAGPGNYLINTAKTSSQILVKSDIGILISIYATTGACNFSGDATSIYLNSTLTLAYTDAAQTTLYNGGGAQKATFDIRSGFSTQARLTISSLGVVSGITYDYC